MTAHTAGPWSDGIYHAVTDGGRTFAFIRASGLLVPIAAVPLGVEGYGRDEGEANARLIAAAPDLLAALELHIAYEAVRPDRGGKNGPKGRAWAAYIEARDTAMAKAKAGAKP